MVGMAQPESHRLSDRLLAEFGLVFALISIAGVGVPMIWPDEKFVGAIFIAFGGLGLVLIFSVWAWRFFDQQSLLRKNQISIALLYTGALCIAGFIWIGHYRVVAVQEEKGERLAAEQVPPPFSIEATEVPRPEVRRVVVAPAPAKQDPPKSPASPAAPPPPWVTDDEVAEALRKKKILVRLPPEEISLIDGQQGTVAARSYIGKWVKISNTVGTKVVREASKNDKKQYVVAYLDSYPYANSVVLVLDREKWEAPIFTLKAGQKITAFCKVADFGESRKILLGTITPVILTECDVAL
jgi:hypothetical protein